MEFNANDGLGVLGATLTKKLKEALGGLDFPGGVGVVFGEGSFSDFVEQFRPEPRKAGLRYKVSERDESVFFSVALAGVHENDVTVDVTEDEVTVSAKFFDDGDEDGSVPVLRSFTYQAEDDSLFVASGVDAKLKRGLLSLRVPVKSRHVETGSRVTIKVG